MISDHFKGKYFFDNCQSEEFLRQRFYHLIATIETVIINKVELDIHKHNILDKYVLFIDKSASWRQLLNELRDLDFNWLTKIVEKCNTVEEAVSFLEE